MFEKVSYDEGDLHAQRISGINDLSFKLDADMANKFVAEQNTGDGSKDSPPWWREHTDKCRNQGRRMLQR